MTSTYCLTIVFFFCLTRLHASRGGREKTRFVAEIRAVSDSFTSPESGGEYGNSGREGKEGKRLVQGLMVTRIEKKNQKASSVPLAPYAVHSSKSQRFALVVAPSTPPTSHNNSFTPLLPSRAGLDRSRPSNVRSWRRYVST